MQRIYRFCSQLLNNSCIRWIHVFRLGVTPCHQKSSYIYIMSVKSSILTVFLGVTTSRPAMRSCQIDLSNFFQFATVYYLHEVPGQAEGRIYQRLFFFCVETTKQLTVQLVWQVSRMTCIMYHHWTKQRQQGIDQPHSFSNMSSSRPTTKSQKFININKHEKTRKVKCNGTKLKHILSRNHFIQVHFRSTVFTRLLPVFISCFVSQALTNNSGFSP